LHYTRQRSRHNDDPTIPHEKHGQHEKTMRQHFKRQNSKDLF